ncbi:hypothetical protein ACNFZZ_24425 (plasmid) [Enterobacter hormaechei]|uniref:hypothetical protein n=1 Tax=Enterobacter hormaechei TaxID=158836 RepID=UPI003CFB0DBE
MFGFSSGALMTLSDDERHLLVSVVSVWLRRAGGDAGAMMLDAYRQILSETEPSRMEKTAHGAALCLNPFALSIFLASPRKFLIHP